MTLDRLLDLTRYLTVPSGSSIHPSKPWCIEHVWDDDVKAVRAEFNALAPQFLDSNDSPETEAILSEFLEKKKRVATRVKQVCYLLSMIFVLIFSPLPSLARSSVPRMGEGPQCGS